MTPRVLPWVLAAGLLVPTLAAAQTRPPPKDPPAKPVTAKDIDSTRPPPKDPPPKPKPKAHHSIAEGLEELILREPADRHDPGDPPLKGHGSPPVKSSPG